MARRAAAPGSRRRHSGVRRRFRLTVWLDEAELAGIRAHAAAAGKAPAAWLGELGTAEARSGDGGRAPSGQVADAVAAMDAAAGQARRAGVLLNQCVRVLHSTGHPPAELDRDAAGVARAVRQMEAATLRVARELLR